MSVCKYSFEKYFQFLHSKAIYPLFLAFFQPLRLDIKRRLTARSDRVKCCDLHPTEPWMLASLYNGNVHVWNHENQTLVKSFEVCDLPVRAAKFVPRKNWVITGSDDMQVSLSFCLSLTYLGIQNQVTKSLKRVHKVTK